MSDESEKIFEEVIDRLDVLETRMMLVAALLGEIAANPLVPASVRKRVATLLANMDSADTT